MTVALHIPAKIEDALRARAEAAGQTVEQFLTAWLERELAWDATRKAWEPTRATSVSEDALVELLEAEKHAMRREKRAS